MDDVVKIANGSVDTQILFGVILVFFLILAALCLITWLIDRARRDQNVIDLLRDMSRERHKRATESSKEVQPIEQQPTKREKIWRALKDWML